jgi:hypothetical protein
MIKAVAVHCHGDTPNEINSSYLAEPRRLNDKLRGEFVSRVFGPAHSLGGIEPGMACASARMFAG